MAKKTALITGISGQDGAYLAKFLLKKNYKVIGTDRRSARSNNWRLIELNIENKVILEDLDITEINNLIRIFQKYNIDEIYNLAAQSFVKSSFDNPIQTSLVNAMAPLSFLEIIRNQKKKIKFYQASTSEMFGKHKINKQNEKTNFHPRSPYATSKTFAHYTVQNYREAYNIFAVSGILFNHESPLRGEEFITRKITIGLAKIMLGKQKKIKLGNIYAKRDWGFAGDYVLGMIKMMEHSQADDWVLATGETHSIKDFLEKAFSHVNLNWEDYVVYNTKYDRPNEVNFLKGDASKAKNELGWEPELTFDDLVKLMVQEDIELANQEKVLIERKLIEPTWEYSTV